MNKEKLAVHLLKRQNPWVPWRGSSGPLWIGLCALLFPASLAAALPPQEAEFVDYLITKLRYLDTASRYLDSLEKSRGIDQNSMADIEFYRVDILRGQGKEQEAREQLDALKRRYPKHPRSQLGSLEAVGMILQRATALLDRAVVEQGAKAEATVAQAEPLFEQVASMLDSVCADFQAKYLDEKKKDAEAKKGLKPDPTREEAPEVIEALRMVTHAELARVNVYLLYAQKLPFDTDKAKQRRKALLEKGLALADAFVSDRFDFPVMQFRGQLQRGIYAYELEKYSLAEEHLNILYGAEPPLSRPFQKPVIDAFKQLRLQAILFGARAAISAGNALKALSIIDKNYLQSKKDELDISTAEEDADLRKIAVLVRLEYGVALAGSGKVAQGLAEIHRIIDNPNQPPALVTDGRKALGRMATYAGVPLSGKDLYQAGLGLKSELRWDAALRTFETALTELDPRDEKEMKEFAPLCLNEIGEINFLKQRFEESALAYQEACSRFGGEEPPHEILPRVAVNFLSAVTRAIRSRPDGATNPVLNKLKEQATNFSESMGGDVAVAQSDMIDARNLMEQGRYDAARKKFLEIPRELKGKKVPFYWLAQANARECTFRIWDQADAEEKPKIEDELNAAASDLTKTIIPQALKDGDKVGAGKGALVLGQIHYQRGQWQEAIDALAVFTAELSDEKLYRCLGLGYLIMAEVKAGKCSAASEHFKQIQEGCADAPIVAVAASEVADCFDDAGDPKQAAEFTLLYARHPAAAADMGNANALVEVARRLIQGGKTAEANEYIERLRKSAKAQDAAIDRQIMYLEGKALAYTKSWREVIAKLKLYLEKYDPKDNHYEDPYVLKDLGDAYLALRAKPSVEELEQAASCYNTACAMMLERKKIDPTLDRLFWEWTLSFMKIQMRLGDANRVNAYRSVQAFVADNKASAMGGPGLKKEFLALEKQAADKLKKAGAK